MRSETDRMTAVKALLVMKYRPMSDTIMGWVESVSNDDGSEADVDLQTEPERERLDADTSVEWLRVGEVDGADHLVGLQIIHASVGGSIDGLPAVINETSHQMVEHGRSTGESGSLRERMLRADERRLEVPWSSLLRPVRVSPVKKAPRHEAKGVEAALSDFIDRLERDLPRQERSEPGLSALRDLLSSVSEGEGLVSSRTAEAAVPVILHSQWSNRNYRIQAASLARFLQHQDQWNLAVKTALTPWVNFVPDRATERELEAIEASESAED